MADIRVDDIPEEERDLSKEQMGGVEGGLITLRTSGQKGFDVGSLGIQTKSGLNSGPGGLSSISTEPVP